MESDGLGLIILGAFGVLLFVSLVFLPLGILVWWLAVGKDIHEKHQQEQQESRERLISKGIVKENKWV